MSTILTAEDFISFNSKTIYQRYSCRIETVECADAYGMHSVAVNVFEGRHDVTVVCLHGFSRNKNDFNVLAEFISKTLGYRVIAIDLPGRGDSDALSKTHQYCQPQMWCDINTVLNAYKVKRPIFIGTSYGGCISMFLGANPQIEARAVIINDAAPTMSSALIDALVNFLQVNPVFETIEEFSTDIRARYNSNEFAKWNLCSDLWPEFINHSCKQLSNGKYTYAYDSRIVEALCNEVAKEHFSMWSVWQRIQAPTLLLRGEKSLVVSAELESSMKSSGPDIMESVTIKDAGHHPMLTTSYEMDIIADFIDSICS